MVESAIPEPLFARIVLVKICGKIIRGVVAQRRKRLRWLEKVALEDHLLASEACVLQCVGAKRARRMTQVSSVDWGQ
jgi:hypothetical protein